MRHLAHLHRDDSGTTLMEAFVAAVVTTTVLAIAFGVIWGFLRHTHGQIALSEVESDSRVVLREMLIHLRESSSPGVDGPVGTIDWDRITVYADAAPSDGVLDRIDYELVNCDGTFCELRITTIPPEDPTAEPLTYSAADGASRVLLTGVIASPGEPLFGGVGWDGAARTTTASCDPCDVGAVAIDLRVRPIESRVNPGTLRILEEVRLRNA